MLTDKRFYFRGKCFAKMSGQYKTVDQEYAVDLEDITAADFVYARRFLLLLLAILLGGGMSLLAPIIDSEECLVFGILVDTYRIGRRLLFLLIFYGKNDAALMHSAGLRNKQEPGSGINGGPPGFCCGTGRLSGV